MNQMYNRAVFNNGKSCKNNELIGIMQQQYYASQFQQQILTQTSYTKVKKAEQQRLINEKAIMSNKRVYKPTAPRPIQQKQATNSMAITGRAKSKKRSVVKTTKNKISNVPKANVTSTTSTLSKAQKRKLRMKQKKLYKAHVKLSKAQKRKLRMKKNKNGNQSVEKNDEKLSKAQ